MAKNRKKQTETNEVEERPRKVDPVQELEREEAAEIEAERGEVEAADSDDRTTLRERIRTRWAAKKEARKNQHKWTMPTWLRISASILLLAGLSIVFTWFILWRSNLCDAEVTNTFIGEKPRIFAYSCLIIFSLMAALAAVTWRPFLSIGISFAAFSIISYIQMEKLRLRGIPLLPEDFLLAGNAGEVSQFADQGSIMRLVWGVVFILVGAAVLEHSARRVIGRNTHQGPWWKRYSVIPHVTFALVALAMLSMTVTPIMMRKNYDWLKDEVDFVEWNQSENYEKNGFILSFIYNLGRLEVKEPEGYSKERMREIAEKYQALRAADTDRLPLTEVADNVIVILDETFYDPILFTKYHSHSGRDVTPNLHRIFRNYPSGYMYSTEYGGGTANVEFAVFSGLSNYWAGLLPYSNSIPRLDARLSVASWARDYGFDTTAIHSYDGSMYKRNLVYPRFGFNEFIDEDKMTYTEHDGSSMYVNDQSVFKEILDILEENDQPQMVGAVTMMNHMPYNSAQYPTLEYRVKNDSEERIFAANYQSIHEADKYVGEFLEALDELDERTVVLWFGDHVSSILNLYHLSDDKSERDLAQLTPYFIYANFEIESLWTVKEVAQMNEELGFEYPVRGVDLPTTTPNCLLNTMFDILGVEKPALFYLVSEVCEETPILVSRYFAGNLPEKTEALTEYELVNYDVLAGKHYWNGE